MSDWPTNSSFLEKALECVCFSASAIVTVLTIRIQQLGKLILESGLGILPISPRSLFAYVEERCIERNSKEVDDSIPHADVPVDVYVKSSECKGKHVRSGYPPDMLDIYLDQCVNEQKKVIVKWDPPFPKIDIEFSEDEDLQEKLSSPRRNEQYPLSHD